MNFYQVLSVDSGGETLQEEGVLLPVSYVLTPQASAKLPAFLILTFCNIGFLNARWVAAFPGTTPGCLHRKVSLVRHLPCNRNQHHREAHLQQVPEGRCPENSTD